MLDLPQRFILDTQGKDSYIIPIINIDDRIYLSTSIVNVSDVVFQPLLKNMGSIRESIDIEKKNFKISSINLSLYNYKYADEYLSDVIFTPSVMNKKITIYMKSQGAKTFDDCLEVYNGYVKNIKESSGTLTIEAEDKTDEVLNKKIPYNFVRDDIEIPEKYRNKPVPIVYGIVDKAPCVYYDLYTTTVQNGSRDWAITPDLSATKIINYPYVFGDKTYGKIPLISEIFSQEKGGTLYRNGTSTQYQILGNRILIPKAIDMGDSPQQSIQGLVAPVTAFGMVEAWAIQDATFNNSKFRFDWGPSGKTNIVAYSEEEGINPTTEVEDSYLMVKDFSSESGQAFPFDHWLWGDEPYGAGVASGESVLNFEVANFFKENQIVKEFPTNDSDGIKEINHVVQVNYSLQANITEIDEATAPKFIFGFTDVSTIMWDPTSEISTNSESTYTISSIEETFDAYELTGGLTEYSRTKKPYDNKFFIGQRILDGENWILNYNNSILNWLKIIKLKLFRRVLLNNFIDFEIYVDMEGRVDNVAGDYTGTPELTSGQRSDYYEGRAGVGIYDPRQGTSLDSRITDKRIPPAREKRVLKTIRKGSKY